jgi:type I restriction enzyme M protein
MSEQNQQQLGKTLGAIADQLRDAMNADDFWDYSCRSCFCAACLRTTKQPPKRNWDPIILLQQVRIGFD